MKRLLFVLGMFCLVSGSALGQQQPATKPAFLIADVHDSPRVLVPFSIGGQIRGDRYSLRQSTLVDMIALAYGVKPEMVQGGPVGWR